MTVNLLMSSFGLGSPGPGRRGTRRQPGILMRYLISSGGVSFDASHIAYCTCSRILVRAQVRQLDGRCVCSACIKRGEGAGCPAPASRRPPELRTSTPDSVQAVLIRLEGG